MLLTGLVVVEPPQSASASASSTDKATVYTRLGAFPWRTENQGWWPILDGGNGSRSNDIFNTVPLVGTHDSVDHVNFFTFDLRAVTRPVTSVVLRIPTGNQAGIHSHFQLHDVSTPPEQLNMTSGFSMPIAHDLASGVLYGGTDVTDARDNSTVRVQLNAAGVAAVNAARGGYFSLGGRLWPHRALIEEHFMFNASGLQDPAASLQMTLGT